MPDLNDYVDCLKDIWQSKILTNDGVYLKNFEKKLLQYLNVKNISLVSSGHSALEMAIKSLNLTGEVITTPYTFPSTINAIINNGLTPVFCDIDAKNLVIDSEKIEALVTSRTTAILPVHIYGAPCNTRKLDEIAKKYNLKIIYDAAHAFGVKLNRESIFNYGDASCVSFHATKILNSIEGGAVISRDKCLIESVNKLRNFGYNKDHDDPELIGSNCKMSEFHAAFGMLNIDIVDEAIHSRKKLYEIYLSRLNNISGFDFVNYELSKSNDVEWNYSYAVILVDKEKLGFSRDDLHRALEDKKIITRKYFYPLCSEMESYNSYSFYKKEFPVAKEVTNKVLCLPIYHDVGEDMINDICDEIINFISRQ